MTLTPEQIRSNVEQSAKLECTLAKDWRIVALTVTGTIATLSARLSAASFEYPEGYDVDNVLQVTFLTLASGEITIHDTVNDTNGITHSTVKDTPVPMVGGPDKIRVKASESTSIVIVIYFA